MSADHPADVEPRILETIPHRPPFLFVDEIVEVDAEAQRIRARRTLRREEAFFDGHYPGRPITPGVLLCEAIFQTGALLVGTTIGLDGFEGKPVLTRIRDAKFRRPVLPGETVDLEVTLTDKLSHAYVFKGTARVDGEDAVRVTFTCALVDEIPTDGAADDA